MKLGGMAKYIQFFTDTQDRQVKAAVRRVAYSTMKGTDIALLELDVTQAELVARGVRPLELEATEPARAGDRVEAVGAPGLFFDIEERFLRRSRCQILNERVDLLEFRWNFRNSQASDCEDIVGGISGSPLIAGKSGKVVGIVNTTTHLAWMKGGDADCYLGRPCELRDGGQRVEEEVSYLIPVQGLLECFDGEGRFQLARPGCPLDPGRQLTGARQGRSTKPGGRWATTLEGAFPYYRYKTVKAGGGTCTDPDGYSRVTAKAERGIIDDPLPDAEGRYLLCIVGGPTAEVNDSWQSVRDATVVVATVDAAAPVWQPRYIVQEYEDAFQVALVFQVPEAADFAYRIGAAPDTVCDGQRYRPYVRIPIEVEKGQGPVRLCFYATDEAGNRSPEVDLVLGGPGTLFPFGTVHAAGIVEDVMAPGQWISIYGTGMAARDLRLTDQAGREQTLEIGYDSSSQVNARIPGATSTGKARLTMGASSVPLQIVPLSPGIFLVEPAAKPEELLVYTSGLAAADARSIEAVMGRTPLRVLSIEKTEVAGVERVRVALPEGHGLRGRQFVLLRAGGRESNPGAVILE